MHKLKIFLFSLAIAVSTTALAEGCGDLDGQSEMNECAIKEFQQLDQKLNRTLKEYKVRLDDEQKLKFRASQLAWIKYRNLSCVFESSVVEGGSVYPLIYNYCLSAKTNARLKELDYLVNCEEGDLSCPAFK